MTSVPRDQRWNVAWTGAACAVCLALAGCGDPLTNSGVAHPGERLVRIESTDDATEPPSDAGGASSDAVALQSREQQKPAAPTASDRARPRTFATEGPAGAVRITFDDLDLLKLLEMDLVTTDCIEKMPDWLKGLNGKSVRIRGYMKPGNLVEGIPQFLFVRSTDLCCFGPKGKVYHMAAVSLKPGTTTDYIELKAFDVVGTFRIEMIKLEDDTIFLLYHIDDAAIIRN